jgi:hypothetical protein
MTSGLRGLAWIATVHWEDVSNRTTSTYTACAGKWTQRGNTVTKN